MIIKYKLFENIELDYSNKNLTKLPKLSDTLKKLWCDNNQLTSLPKLPNNLKDLDCDNNQLTQLPKLPNNLKTLWCQYNQLTQLPELPDNLIELWCYNNQLTKLPELPDNLKISGCNNNWKEPLSKEIKKFILDPYTKEQIELFNSYEFQKEYIEKDNNNYFNLYQKNLIIHPRIKKEYMYIGSIKDMGVL